MVRACNVGGAGTWITGIALLIAGIVAAGIYILGTTSLLVTFPVSVINIIGGVLFFIVTGGVIFFLKAHTTTLR